MNLMTNWALLGPMTNWALLDPMTDRPWDGAPCDGERSQPDPDGGAIVSPSSSARVSPVTVTTTASPS